ncbi:MAG: organic hydroperoxide resistance protein [Motiliproteus sp.]
MQAIYSATATSTGGRDGRSVSSDEKLNIALSTPKELGGAGGSGTNPEQLFAAGYSACFIGAMKYVAGQQKITLPGDLDVTATIGIGENPQGVGFAICADLTVSLPGFDKTVADKIVADAHQVCPYSNATRGNIEVTTSVKVSS